jgi:predicted nucleic acid-binding protein
MNVSLLVDTGPLVALLDRSDIHHPWAVQCFKQLRAPLFTCEAVMAETMHLLRKLPPSLKTLAIWHGEGIFRCSFDFQAQAPACWKLLGKYADTPMDFADACMVRMAEIHPNPRVWTTDTDFQIYRRNARAVIPLLAPWEKY